MKNIILNKIPLERIEEVYSQNDHSTSKINFNKNDNLIDYNENYIFVFPLKILENKDIVSDYLKYGEIKRIYKDDDKNCFKVVFENKDSVINSFQEFKKKKENKSPIKYIIEIGSDNRVNNLNFRNIIYDSNHQINSRNETGKIRNNKYNENQGNTFGSIFNKLKFNLI